MLQLSESSDPTALDLAHVALLQGTAASLKPERVLELGVGSGYATDAVLQALAWNGRGELTCVDNWCDWGGREPPHARDLRDRGVTVVHSEEGAFVRAAPTDRYDLVISDAAHGAADRWVEDSLRIVRPEGVLFFHDTANPDFPNLARITAHVARAGLPHYHFARSTRPGERCGRGWLMVTNRKAPVALVTAWDGAMAAVAEVVLPNQERYCRRHGYALHAIRMRDGTGCWIKPRAVREGFGLAPWVCWMDLDAVVVNPSVTLDILLDTDADLVVSADRNGLNNGVLCWRRGPWAWDMLDRWEGHAGYYAGHPNAEQTTLAYLLYREPRDKVRVVPQRLCNSYRYELYGLGDYLAGQYQPGDFVLHLPGLPNERRLEILRDVLRDHA
jgi:SAM-dependent methyltransferase